MNQELQVRIEPITSRLWMLVPKTVQAQGETRSQPERAETKRRKTGQLIRTSA